MNKTSVKSWLNDPITRLGSMNFFTMMILTLYRGYLPIYLTNDIIVSIVIFTIIISSINFFQIFMRIPLGNLSQVVGRKPMILIGNFSINVAVLLLFIANNFVLVFISALLVGIGMSCHWPASFSYIQDTNIGNNYGKNNGRIFKLGDLGILLGSLYAKIFLDQFLLDLRLFFFTMSILGFFAIILFYFILPESLDDDHKVHITLKEFIHENFVNMIAKFKEITFYPGMLRIYMLQISLSFAEFFMVVFFPLLLDSQGYSKGTLGEIIFWATFVLLWLKPYLGSVSDRFGYRSPVLFTLTGLALLYLSAPLISGLIVLIVYYFIVYLLIFIGYPSVNNGAASTSPVKQRGLALGALGVYTSLGRSSSTIIMSPIWEQFNINDTFIISGIFILILVFILYFITKDHNNLQTNTNNVINAD